MKLLILAFALVATVTAKYAVAPVRQAKVYEPFMNTLKTDIKRFIDRFPTLKRLVDENTSKSSEVIKKISGRGLTYYSQQASMQAIEGVSEDDYEGFTDYMIEALAIPGNQKDTVKRELFQVIQLAENSDWVQHKLTFSVDKGGAVKYICILGHSNFGQGTYDFVVADFKTSFQLAPDIILVQERKSYFFGLYQTTKTRVVEIPATLKMAEMEALTNFFDLAAFTRFAQMLNLPAPMGIEHDDSYADPITIIAAISAGVKLFGEIANTFKTTITKEIIKEITRTGYDHFVSSSRAHILQKLRGSFYDRYVGMTQKLYQIPDNVIEEVHDILELSKFTGSQVWNKNDFLFKINTIGTNRFINILSHNNEEDINDYTKSTFDILVVNCEQEFRLAPNIIVIQTSRSFVGGIYQDNKLEFKEMPRDLNADDIKVLMGFFHIITMQRFAINLGIKLEEEPPTPPK